MSETIAPTEADDEPLGFDPADILLNLVVTLLVPLFITAAGGELYFARMAALATIESYRGRTQADLLTILQIITFSLGAADSVCRSMADDLSLPMVLRLRGSANSTARTAERNRLVLAAAAKADPVTSPNPPRPSPPHHQPPLPDAPLPDAPRTDPRPAASFPSAAPLPAAPLDAAPSQAAPPAATETEPSEAEIQQLWANAMSTVAAEFAADLDHLPPDERQEAQTRIRALNHCAVELRSGHPPPRPRPGDLRAAPPT